MLSDFCDKQFKDCPVIKNELINKDKLSANITSARRALMAQMLTCPHLPRLGMEKYPPQVMLYISVLESSGLHIQDNGQYKFICDRKDNAPLKSLWDATFRLLESGKKVSLSEIYELWRKPPIGLKAGLAPILSLVFYLANLDQTYLYINGAFEPELDETILDDWLLNPEIVQLRFQKDPKQIQALLNNLSAVLTPFNGKEISPSALPIGREIVRIVLSIPGWTQKTTKLSAETKEFRKIVTEASDPIKLLCEDLQTLFGNLAPDLIAQKVADCLRELVNASPEMISEVRSYLYKCIDSTNLDELRQRARTISPIAGKLQLQAFVGRISNLTQQDESIESILTLALSKPKKLWTDRDIQDALNQISDWCLSFRHLESFAALQSLTSNRRIVSLVMGDQQNNVEAIVDFSTKPNQVVSQATDKILSILTSLEDSEAQATLIASCLKIFDRKNS